MDLKMMAYEDLVYLNRRIIAELRTRDSDKQMVAASKFRIGDIVEFSKRTGDHLKIRGIVQRINQKSILLRDCTDGSGKWSVSPSLLKKVEPK